MSTRTYNIKINLVDTGEVFIVTNVSNKTEIRNLKTNLELVAGIPSHLQRIMYLDQGKFKQHTITFIHLQYWNNMEKIDTPNKAIIDNYNLSCEGINQTATHLSQLF